MNTTKVIFDPLTAPIDDVIDYLGAVPFDSLYMPIGWRVSYDFDESVNGLWSGSAWKNNVSIVASPVKDFHEIICRLRAAILVAEGT